MTSPTWQRRAGHDEAAADAAENVVAGGVAVQRGAVRQLEALEQVGLLVDHDERRALGRELVAREPAHAAER